MQSQGEESKWLIQDEALTTSIRGLQKMLTILIIKIGPIHKKV
jgi:hypothetical protein